MAETPDELRDRIKEFDNKSNQLLIFLSFALVVSAVLGVNAPYGSHTRVGVVRAMRFWAFAIFPILLTILPIKEFRVGSERWYRIVRWFKVVLLWISIAIIIVGAVQFYDAIAF